MDTAVKTRAMTRLIPILLLTLLLSGCAGDPISQSKTNNPNFEVALLFENDGCKVYRFHDNMRYHYYATCRTGDVHTSTEQSEGKTTYPEDIHTAEVRQ